MATLREIRQRRNLSQREFARDLPIDRTTLSRLENGQRQLTFELFCVVVDVHDVTDAEILRYVRGSRAPSVAPVSEAA